MEIISLPWDSQLFGYSVGCLVIDIEDFDSLEFLEQEKQFKLVYIISQNQIRNLPKNTILVDTKVTLVKELNEVEDLKDVEIFEGELSDNLISLGFQSGDLSRFKIDKRLSHKEFEKLYIKWLERDLKSGKIIIHKIGGKIVGMITLGFNKDQSTIGLFAVDNDYRRMGIGKELLESAESMSLKHGLKKISVQTQLQNKGALRIYMNNGFEEQEKKFIYHFFN